MLSLHNIIGFHFRKKSTFLESVLRSDRYVIFGNNVLLFMWLCSQRGLFLGLLCFGLVGFLLFDHHASDDNRWASATPSFNLAKLQAGGSEFAQQQCKAYMESESYYRDGNHLQWDRLGVEKHALAMNTTHVHGRPPVFHYIVSNDPKRDGPFKPRMLMFYSVLSTYFVGKSMCWLVSRKSKDFKKS